MATNDRISRPKTLKFPKHALQKTVAIFGVAGVLGLWFKVWHASYLRCGLPEEEWQNYDEDFKRKEDERWNINREAVQHPDYFKDFATIQKVKQWWVSFTGRS